LLAEKAGAPVRLLFPIQKLTEASLPLVRRFVETSVPALAELLWFPNDFSWAYIAHEVP